ncbi:MAG: NAD(P)/FAD-dependent oxidoreductase [Acidobacteria bacterium]|nr:NAD(P)/FAD-dependent oxidoreductase [Acidobacteriota bacterium]
MKIVIIGNSAASTAAIETIRAEDKDSSIVQISEERHPLYSRCLLSYYLADKIDKNGLAYRSADFHKKMDVQLHPGRCVEEVDPAGQKVTCSDGSAHSFDRLLIATGSSAKIPDNIPETLRGVFVLRTVADAEAIKQKLSGAKKAVVLGGGLVGMRAADALCRAGLKVFVVIGSNRILSRMIDYEAARIVGTRVRDNDIEVMTGSDVSEVLHKDGNVVGVVTDNGLMLDCEILIVAKSVRANTGLIRNTDIKTRRGIETNASMQTNYENIYAAGDVAETFDITTEEYTVNALWTCAVQQGRIAGQNIARRDAAGIPAKYAGSVAMNSLNFWGIPIISFGVTVPEDESRYTILKDSRPEQNVYKKIVIADNRIKGLILVGRIANAGVLFSLVQNKMDVAPFMDQLLGDRFNFGHVVRHGGKPVLEKYYRGLST